MADQQQVIWEGHTVDVIEENFEAEINVETSSSDNSEIQDDNIDLARTEEIISRGCGCRKNCFYGLIPENVYKHQLNIQQLSKEEHDMYLMGITIASLSIGQTRNKENSRLRVLYIYQGRRVCLYAFMYLESCTHYQLKQIRKHLMINGITPRIHGNRGRKPHNTISRDIYQHAKNFVKKFLEEYIGQSGIINNENVIRLPWVMTRKMIFQAYKEDESNVKKMGFSTFRRFLMKSFPNIKFWRVEAIAHQDTQVEAEPQQEESQGQLVEVRPSDDTENSVLNGEDMPIMLISENNEITERPQTAFLMHLPKLTANEVIEYVIKHEEEGKISILKHKYELEQ